jgi:hypothetical protein
MLDQSPVRICCGQRHDGAVCPDMHFMCCLCFDRFPVGAASRPHGFVPWCPPDELVDVCWPCAYADGPERLFVALIHLLNLGG